MCDIAREKQKIDALLERAARAAPAPDGFDEEAFAASCLDLLSDHYSDACPDECLRRRCRDFAAEIARRRSAARWRRAAAERRTLRRRA